MDSSTQKLKDMIQRMTELDTPEKKKQKLDEAVSMTMSGETADEVASLAKLLGNAGLNDAPAQSAPPMPARQDMERLAGIMGDPEPMNPGEESMPLPSVRNGQASNVDESADSVQSEFIETVKIAMTDLEEVGDGDVSNETLEAAFRAFKSSDFETAADLIVSGYKNQTANNSIRDIYNDLVTDFAQITKSNKEGYNSTPKDIDDDYTDRSVRKGEMASADHESEWDEGYDNEPDADYQDTEYMTKDLSGGMNRRKKSYADAEDGDNPMAVESIKDRLYAQLSEKKAKPDYADIDNDGDKKEPMKKAAKDKKKDK